MNLLFDILKLWRFFPGADRVERVEGCGGEIFPLLKILLKKKKKINSISRIEKLTRFAVFAPCPCKLAKENSSSGIWKKIVEQSCKFFVEDPPS